jgi:hypothetical protein
LAKRFQPLERLLILNRIRWDAAHSMDLNVENPGDRFGQLIDGFMEFVAAVAMIPGIDNDISILTDNTD